ncbi:MAG: hypothetical protein ACRD0J_09930 [Acidimicrobiales bacterium]
MGRWPLIARSARKHSVADEDILHAWSNAFQVTEYDEGFVLYIGADRAANLIEVGSVQGTDGEVIVHALPARRDKIR